MENRRHRSKRKVSPLFNPHTISKRRRGEFKNYNHAIDEGTRRWVSSSRDVSSFKERFVVVSYNILGVENASKHPDLYDQVASENLCWDQRKKHLLEELTHYDPSILCFQEVDRFKDLADLLQKDGYIGIYKGRTGEANDGCAIFWKEGRFSLIHQEDIEFQKFGLRNNVAQLCLLKVRRDCHSNLEDENSSCSLNKCTSSPTVLVGNIHVLFNPNRGDIKLGQVRLLLERANTLSKQHGNSPIVLCGDLNSIPKSAIYEYITSPEIDILKYDRKNVSGQIKCIATQRIYKNQYDGLRRSNFMINHIKYKWSAEEILLASGSSRCTCIGNPLKLFSAYQGTPVNNYTRDTNGEPLATSFHSKFMGTVDYIWHCSALVPVRVLDTLPVHILRKLRGLPSKKWPSDHLALVCEFAFADKTCFASTSPDS